MGLFDRKLIAFAIAASAIVTASGCGSDKGSSGGSNGQPGSNPVTGTSADELQGAWESACVDADFFGLTQNMRRTFNGAVSASLTRVSTRGDCDSTDVEVIQEASYGKGPEIFAGVHSIDLRVTSVRVKPKNARGVGMLKLGRACGNSDWEIGKEVTVTEQIGSETCFPTLTLVRFDIYSIDGNNLYFGKESEMSVSSRRPVELEREFPYTRQ